MDGLRRTFSSGYSMLEVIIAFFIFGCVSAAIFKLIGETDRVHARAVFVGNAARLASGEAERLRSCAAKNTLFEDSTYLETVGGRTYRIDRDLIENTPLAASFAPRAREPLKVELRVADANDARVRPLRFKILVGQDNP